MTDNTADTKRKKRTHRVIDKRLADQLAILGYERGQAYELIEKEVYILSKADEKHIVSEMSNGMDYEAVISNIRQGKRVRLARKIVLMQKKASEEG
jgi:hypothetical protein